MGRKRPTGGLSRLLSAALCVAAGIVLAVYAPDAIGAPPTVTVTEPAGGSIVNESIPIFGGKAEPAYGAVTVELFSGSAAAGIPLWSETTVLTPEGAWSVVSPDELADGVYTVTASQTNEALEKGTSTPSTFRIETSAPVVTLNPPQPTPGETAPSFIGTASDTTPVSIQIREGTSPKGKIVSLASATGTGGGWHSSAASPALPVGTYTATAVQVSGKLVGRSDPMPFEVVPPLPAPPAPSPGSSSPLAGVASLINGARPKPALMTPFPVVRIAGVSFGSGVKLRLLKVQQAPAGATVIVRCHGRGCPKGASRRTTASGPHGVPAIVFGRFERYLRAGAVVEVLVSKSGLIGKWTRLRVRRGKLPERVDLCLDAAGVKPIACPAS
jgi:hypothetical protein